ncbi:MAG: LysR family transcriptional regulator [Sneathiella sp.]
MDIRQLRQFIAVAEEKNYRIAAERLHMSQPPLSISIKKLEESLDVRLLNRSKKHVELTAAGAVFLQGAYETLSKIEQISNDTKRAEQGLVGRLVIGFAGSAIYDTLPSSIRRFSANFPDVELELVEMATIDQLAALSRGTIDAGFLRPPLSGSTLYELTPIQTEKLVAVMPETHILSKASIINLADLATDSFIVFPHKTSPNLYALVLLACRDAGFTPDICQTASQIQTQISLVSAGLGVALVPECAMKAPHHGVVYKPLMSPADVISTQMSLATVLGQKSKLLQAFMENCQYIGASRNSV